jgi:hypothetical protein
MLTDWQKHAINAIATGLLEYEAQQLCLDKLVNPVAAKKWVSGNKYPFGMRENHPYQVWLSECKLITVFLSLGIAIKHYGWWRESYKKPRKPNSDNEKRKHSYNPDQLTLF